MIKKNRIIFLTKEENEHYEFFKPLAKQYKGRFYKKLSEGQGWSFPIEYQTPILEQWQIFQRIPKVEDENENENVGGGEEEEESDTSSSEIPEIEDTVASSNASTSTSSSSDTSKRSYQELQESDSSSDSSSDPLLLLQTPTQTEASTQTLLDFPKENKKYLYDIPSVLKQQFSLYKNLLKEI